METNGTGNGAQLVCEEDGSVLEQADNRREDGESVEHPVFGPLVNRIALSIAKELAAAIQELDHHISLEARRAGEGVERRIDPLTAELAELARFAAEQRSINDLVQHQVRQFEAADAELQEANRGHARELESLRTEVRDFSGSASGRLDGMAAWLEALQNETRASFHPVWERIDNICRDLDGRREDIAVTRTTLDSISSRIDACVERLDRHAEGVRSLHGAYGRRETELEQIVEGLVRLRACAQPAMPEGL